GGGVLLGGVLFILWGFFVLWWGKRGRRNKTKGRCVRRRTTTPPRVTISTWSSYCRKCRFPRLCRAPATTGGPIRTGRARPSSRSKAQPQTRARAARGSRSPFDAPGPEPACATEPLRCRDEVGQFLARIEHARFDRGLANADDIGDLFDRFAVVVDEVDHLAVLRRQLGQGAAQQFASALLLQHGLRIVRGISDLGCDPCVQFRIDPTAPG